MINQYLSAWYSRISLGLVFFGAIVVGLWPEHHWDWDGEKLIACILAGLAWLAAELATVKPKPSQHDLDLLNQIRTTLNEDAQTFLLNHDFSINLHTRYTDPVNNIALWHGSNYIFDDQRVHQQWSVLFDKIVNLSHLYGATLVNTDREGILTAWLTGYTRHNQPQTARDEVKALNDAANDVYTTYTAFVLFARKRLSV